jgi:hypothetical protein
MVLGGMGFGAWQTFKGVSNVATALKEGRGKDAEKAFGDIAEGAFTAVTSAVGMKSAGSIAAETKVTTTALKTATTAESRIAAVQQGIAKAAEVRGGSLSGAFKETLSLVFTKEGRSSMVSQLNPKALVTNTKQQLSAVSNLFKEQTVDLAATKLDIEQQLNISKESSPKLIHEFDSSWYKGKVVGGAYLPFKNELYMPKDETTLAKQILKLKLKGLARLFNKNPEESFLYKWINKLEKLPKPLHNFLTNMIRKLYANPKNVLAHELTHKAQRDLAVKLSREQAKSVLSTKLQLSESNLQELLTGLPFAEQPLEGNAVAASEEALVNLSNLLVQNPLAMRNGNGFLKNYIASPAEIEARIAGSKYQYGEAINNLKNASVTDLSTYRSVRSVELEQRMNNLLAKIGPATTDADLNAIRNELFTLAKLTGSVSPTGNLIRDYQAMSAQMEAQAAVERFFDKIDSRRKAGTTQSPSAANPFQISV